MSDIVLSGEVLTRQDLLGRYVRFPNMPNTLLGVIVEAEIEHEAPSGDIMPIITVYIFGEPANRYWAMQPSEVELISAAEAAKLPIRGYLV